MSRPQVPTQIGPPRRDGDLHALAEERSLALHRVVAERLRVDPTIVAGARERVARWLETGHVALPYAEAWCALLRGSEEEIAAAIVDDGERARSLRQCTPFTFVVSPRERWKLWAAVRAGWEAPQ